MEEATFLTKFATKVSVIHRRDNAPSLEDHAGQGSENPKIKFHLEHRVDEVIGQKAPVSRD